DLPAAAAHLAGLGIRLFRSDGRPLEGSPGEDAFFTHPRDTHGALEFASAGKHRPPEELPAPEPGSRVIRAVRLISLVADLAGATSTYERALGGVVVAAPHHEGQHRSAVIELASGHRVE